MGNFLRFDILRQNPFYNRGSRVEGIVLRIASDAIVNTDQAIRQFIELIQSNLPEEDRRKPIDSSQIPIIMAQAQHDTYVHADTGWPLVVYYTRTTQVGENKSGQEISLEIDIPE